MTPNESNVITDVQDSKEEINFTPSVTIPNNLLKSTELSKMIAIAFPEVNNMKFTDIEILRGLTEGIFTKNVNPLLGALTRMTNEPVRNIYEDILSLADEKNVTINDLSEIDTMFEAGRNKVLATVQPENIDATCNNFEKMKKEILKSK